MSLSHHFPILSWGRRYDRTAFTGDAIAAVIVTIMLVPQSLAYALLAGMPPEAGPYASIAPILLYAIFGTSHALAVGPVAVVSLMTAAAVGNIAESGTAGYVAAALTLAFMSGAMLLALGLFRLGFLANFLSHPVIAGFITAGGILIAASQLRHILGIEAEGHTLIEILASLWAHLGEVNVHTLAIGASATAFLYWVHGRLKPLLHRAGLGPRAADLGAKSGPVLGIVATTLAVWFFNLGGRRVAIVGAVPQTCAPPSPTGSRSRVGSRARW